MTRARRVALAASACALVAGGALLVLPRATAPAVPPAVVASLVDGLRAATVAAHDDAPTTTADTLVGALADLAADEAALRSVEELAGHLDDVARSTPGVGDVTVEQVGGIEAVRRDGDRVTVLVVVRTSRHVVVDDVDWVEVVPHELTVDDAGRLVHVRALDPTQG